MTRWSYLLEQNKIENTLELRYLLFLEDGESFCLSQNLGKMIAIRNPLSHILQMFYGFQAFLNEKKACTNSYFPVKCGHFLSLLKLDCP